MSGDPTSKRKEGWLKVIGVFKLLKASLLVLLGIAALELARQGMAYRAEHWLADLAVRTREVLPLRVIDWMARANPARLDGIGAASFGYAALFLTEGINLCRGKRWAEYLTIVATGSFVPFEIYELVRRATALRVSALVINIAVVAYLIWHVRRSRRESSSAMHRPVSGLSRAASAR